MDFQLSPQMQYYFLLPLTFPCTGFCPIFCICFQWHLYSFGLKSVKQLKLFFNASIFCAPRLQLLPEFYGLFFFFLKLISQSLFFSLSLLILINILYILGQDCFNSHLTYLQNSGSPAPTQGLIFLEYC